MNTPERYVENDIGRALTAEQMNEYSEVREAEDAGRDLKSLRWASNIGVVLITLCTIAWIYWSLKQH